MYGCIATRIGYFRSRLRAGGDRNMRARAFASCLLLCAVMIGAGSVSAQTRDRIAQRSIGGPCICDPYNVIRPPDFDCEAHCSGGGGAPAAPSCAAGWMLSSRGGCIPLGAVECPSGGYCDQGHYCASGRSCIPIGSIDCGSHSCPAGNYCSSNGRYCFPNGSLDCGGFHCAAGNTCGRSSCLPLGSVECSSGGYCREGYECGPPGSNSCEPKGSRLRRECIKANEAQLRFLRTEIRGLVDHIANASDAAAAANTELQDWLSESERARQQAIETAIHNLFELAKVGLYEVSLWRHPPPSAGRAKAALINFGRRVGLVYRKYEMNNPRFIKYSYSVMKGLEKEQKFKTAETFSDYVHAIGGLAQVMAELSGGYAKRLVGIKHLIAAGEIDYDIWKDDLYAYWVVVMTAYKARSDLEIPDQRLKDIALWSGMLHTEMTERRRLTAQRDNCPKAGN
jgi:hypothetical protein